jgi:UrcA family protein
MNYGKALVACGAILVASAAIGVTAAPVHARSPGSVVIVAHSDNFVVRRVSYADLNIASEPGVRDLTHRVGWAVVDVCNDATAAPAMSFELRNCKTKAWGAARPQISLAVQRAHEMASTGTSSIAAAAITITVPQ